MLAGVYTTKDGLLKVNLEYQVLLIYKVATVYLICRSRVLSDEVNIIDTLDIVTPVNLNYFHNLGLLAGYLL
jgi:hypothetical protein